MITAKTTSTLSPEEREVYRRLAYEEMGFTPEQAKILSKIPKLFTPDVLETYLNKGCSTDLAFRILSP